MKGCITHIGIRKRAPLAGLLTNWQIQCLDDVYRKSVTNACSVIMTNSFLKSFFNPNKEPYLQVGFRGDVDVDCGSHAVIASLADYHETVKSPTWNAVLKFAERAKQQNLKIAFFSATPQGGGVALMRHALVRFLRLLDVDITW